MPPSPPAPGLKKAMEALLLAQGSSCTCMTKTPDAQRHNPACMYRIYVEALDRLGKLAQRQPADARAWERLVALAAEEYNEIGAAVQEGDDRPREVPEWARLVAGLTTAEAGTAGARP